MALVYAMTEPANANIAPEPEALLMLRVAAGDAAAFSQLARMLTRPSLALATRVLGDAALAEDAVQEAFARLWREAGKFDPTRGSFGGWWRRMLMNIALDGKRRVRIVSPLDEAHEIADARPGPDMLAQSADVSARVQAAAAALPARQRAALALFHGDGMSMAEIGVVLETSEKAVEGLLLRGRAALKDRLMAQGGADWISG